MRSVALLRLAAVSRGLAYLCVRDELPVMPGCDTEAGAGVAGGSLIGMLVGVLGGPVGMLLSGSAGAASGALYDADRLDKGDEAIEQFGALMPTGGNALL